MFASYHGGSKKFRTNKQRWYTVKRNAHYETNLVHINSSDMFRFVESSSGYLSIKNKKVEVCK